MTKKLRLEWRLGKQITNKNERNEMKKTSTNRINILKKMGLVSCLAALSVVGLTGCAGDRSTKARASILMTRRILPASKKPWLQTLNTSTTA